MDYYPDDDTEGYEFHIESEVITTEQIPQTDQTAGKLSIFLFLLPFFGVHSYRL